MSTRGIKVDHSTIQRWVFKFSKEVEDAISQNLTFNQGDYGYDGSLGEFGGYRIYLD